MASIQQLSISNFGMFKTRQWTIQGQRIFLTGPSRSGKTTLLRALHATINMAEYYDNDNMIPHEEAAHGIEHLTEVKLNYTLDHHPHTLHTTFEQNCDGNFTIYIPASPEHMIKSCFSTPDLPCIESVADNFNAHFGGDPDNLTEMLLLLFACNPSYYNMVILTMKQLYPDTSLVWRKSSQLEGYQPIIHHHLVSHYESKDTPYQVDLCDESREFQLTFKMIVNVVFKIAIDANTTWKKQLHVKNLMPQLAKEIESSALPSPEQGLVIFLLIDTLDIHPSLWTVSFWQHISSRCSHACHFLLVGAGTQLSPSTQLWEWSVCSLTHTHPPPCL